MITRQLLNERFYYKDGFLYFKHSNKKLTGTLLSSGYLKVGLRIEGILHQKLYHTLIWIFHYGCEPTMLDHSNRIRNDNRIENLRECNRFQNQANKAKGRIERKHNLPKGVDKHKNKFRSRIIHNNTYIHIGTYDTSELAHEAYKKKCLELNGEFANFGES